MRVLGAGHEVIYLDKEFDIGMVSSTSVDFDGVNERGGPTALIVSGHRDTI